MSEEEKDAFNYYKGCNEKDLLAFEFLGDISKKRVKYMELLLNLIEKQQKEIEELKKKSYKCEYLEEGAEEIIKNSIGKDKIRRKIEEYENDYNRQDKEELFNLTKITAGKISSLNELLKEKNDK